MCAPEDHREEELYLPLSQFFLLHNPLLTPFLSPSKSLAYVEWKASLFPGQPPEKKLSSLSAAHAACPQKFAQSCSRKLRDVFCLCSNESESREDKREWEKPSIISADGCQ